MRLILIRHGQTPSNIANLLDTLVPGPDLTALGRAQAETLVTTMNEDADAFYVSTQVRSQQTAAPLAARLGLEVRVRHQLREIESGDFQMLGDPVSHEHFHGQIFRWADGDPSGRIPGGETGLEVFARVDEVLAEATEEGVERLMILAHGALIRTWVGAHAINTAPGFARASEMPNTGYAILTGSRTEGWILENWNGEPIPASEATR
ncbi:histidine phosphatase family protein [Mycetocola tolaasinivorans]|uniref:Histidine phosphatase family protein n=1 Tax=Mycetocola tolaasinivorans TaxID=76635 RepID=A0A3L7A763_9MICO|nr:histidine phosphatase family protein [Mycetocola tolaasinivorans]RLP75680.1 histidine phosphatase family protein [Mycetocola tolaasinivorans]